MLTFTSRIYNEERQIYFLRVSIQNLIKYMKTMKQDARNGYELQKVFVDKMSEISKGIISNSNIRYSLTAIDILKYLSIHTTELESIYNQVIREEKETGVKVSPEEVTYYSTDIEANKLKVVRQCLASLREDVQGLNTYEDKSVLPILCLRSKKDRDRVLDEIERKYGKAAKVDMQERIRLFRTPEVELLKEKMQGTSRNYERILKEKYMESLIFIGNFFKEFGLIKNYVNSNNNNLSQIGLNKIGCTEEDLITLFTEEYLQTLSVEQLTYLNVFWLNRFTKEMENIAKAGFILTDLNLWLDIFDGKAVDISDEELKWELLKIDTLENFEIECLDEKPDNEILKKALKEAASREGAPEEIVENGAVKLDFSGYINMTNEKYGRDYSNRYSWKLPRSENVFRKEIGYFKDAYNAIQNAYKLKDIALSGILHNLQLNERIINWGIMRQSESESLLSRKNLLVGIDLNGMNMPIRLHIPKDIVVEIIHENQKNNANVIPIYAGNDDYRVEIYDRRKKIDWITSPILMPVSDEQKQILKENIENLSDERYYKLFHHLGYIYGIADFPEHLKTTVVERRKGKKLERRKFIKQYINVDTEEIIDENQLNQLKKQNKGDDSR